MNIELLKEATKLIKEAASRNGLVLSKQFKTQEAFKEFVISFTFKGLRDAGLDTSQAFNLLFGEGAIEKMMEELKTA